MRRSETGGRFEVRLRVVAGNDQHEELASLRDWLVHEDELRGRVRQADAAVGSGEMGALSDVLVVALSGGSAVTVLARSVPTWLKQRRADVTIEIVGPDGQETKVTATRVPDAEAIIRGVLDTHKP
jgi:hypothetical protein